MSIYFLSRNYTDHSFRKPRNIDTTSTYVEMEYPGDPDLPAYGKSKYKRDDLPQITIGLAVTREGIPARCRVLPGNQNDAKCVDQIQKDMNDWKLGHVDLGHGPGHDQRREPAKRT